MSQTYFSRASLPIWIVTLALVFVVAIVAVAALAGTSTIGSGYVLENAQALALAHAGLEWYLENLKSDVDWTSPEAVRITRSFGDGEFQIVSRQVISLVQRFTSEGRVIAPDGNVISRRMSVTAEKISPAFLFALFHGLDSGSANPLRILDTKIKGDVWTHGSVVIEGTTTVDQGKIYVASENKVTGSVVPFKVISNPRPVVPVIDRAHYAGLMDTYDAVINSASGKKDINQTSDLVLTGNTIATNNFVTAGNITISGTGTIVSFRDINLHSGNEANRTTLTINPYGGDILLLSGGDLDVAIDGGGSEVVIYKETGGTGICRLYSRGRTDGTQAIDVRGPETQLHGVAVYARRSIRIRQGAHVDNGSQLFCDLAESNQINQIELSDSGTWVEGAVISTGRSDVNLHIVNGASVTGPVYSYAEGLTSCAELNNCNIQGSVVVSRLCVSTDNSVNLVRSATIAYDAEAVSSALPEGFEGYVIKRPKSWDGL